MTDGETTVGGWRRKLAWAFVIVLLLAAPIGGWTWYKFFRVVPQPDWVTHDPEQYFLHGSIGAEGAAGIPYWILVVLPRLFDDYMPGPGGYAAFGLPWKEGDELPAGFSKQRVGFDRVAFNCALCHATQYRAIPDTTPTIVAAGGSHTADIEGLMNFFTNAANDSRFSGETMMTQIDLAYRLGFLDRLLYKYVYIPLTRKQLRAQGAGFAWATARPRWGPGRDAPMNLTKFNFLQLPADSSIDNTDFPSIWHLDARVQAGRTWPDSDYALHADWARAPVPPDQLMLMNLDGATTSYLSVIFDSALGLQAENSAFFRRRMHDLEAWLRTVPPPRYPLPIDSGLAARGQPLFERECAACHASGRPNRLGTVIPVEEVGTDPERTNAWTQQAADSANATVAHRLGIRRTPMGKPARPGYIALQLDGLWLRAPYLHNGSVPTLRALLEPPPRRPRGFYRGYDVLDRVNVGFIARRCPGDQADLPAGPVSVEWQWGCMPSTRGWWYDTGKRGNGNGGHAWGTTLTDAEKASLVEYLKTF
jgi:RoxA-like, cytochrome c-like